MLLEFVLTNGVAAKNTPPRPLFLLMNQIVAVHEPPSYMTDVTGGDAVRRCMVTIRGGNEFEVADPVDDVLDAMKFASRHIGVTPGIADKLDGETGEEIYPWRRTEKVSELARKWREHQKGQANSRSRPSYSPPGAMSTPLGKLPPEVPPLTREGVRRVEDTEVTRSGSRVVVSAPAVDLEEAFRTSDVLSSSSPQSPPPSPTPSSDAAPSAGSATPEPTSEPSPPPPCHPKG